MTTSLPSGLKATGPGGNCDPAIGCLARTDGTAPAPTSATATDAANSVDRRIRILQRKLPIAWLRAGNRKPGTLEPTSLGAEQGKVVFERFEPRLRR